MLSVFQKVAIPALFLFTANTTFAETLPEARSKFETKIIQQVEDDGFRFATPPSELFTIIQYESQVGALSALLGKPKDTNKKYPAIIWLTGGFPVGGIDEAAWLPQPKDNDQSAKAYREAGVIMMYPSLRGTMGNPGQQEGFYGEVDDVLSALAYLKQQKFVDPDQIYLGGHSTGGTLALLVAESTDEFKAVFSFGPVEAPIQYGTDYALHDSKNYQENRLRSPFYFLDSIVSPTYIIEGRGGNYDNLATMERTTQNRNVLFMPITGADHFSTLQPINEYLAKLIVESKGSPLNITKTDLELVHAEGVQQ
jgi:dipeptidyl aminopeptidase/acylaminoacyl peptidase